MSKFTDWVISHIGHYLNKETGAKKAYLTDFDSLSYEIRPADVLLVEGTNHISTTIRHVTNSPWTHAALYIGRLHDIDDPALRAKIQEHYIGPPDSQLLIESMLGEGTVVTPLAQYRNNHARICRPQGLMRQDAQKIIGYVINRLGQRYSLRHIIDLYRFLIPYSILPRRWRSSLFMSHASLPTEDICSSMIAHAFTSVHFPILPIVRKDSHRKALQLIRRNPRIFVPSDFDYSPYFSIIKYPLFNISVQQAYKNLPWEQNLMGINEDEIYEVNDESSNKNTNEEDS